MPRQIINPPLIKIIQLDNVPLKKAGRRRVGSALLECECCGDDLDEACDCQLKMGERFVSRVLQRVPMPSAVLACKPAEAVALVKDPAKAGREA